MKIWLSKNSAVPVQEQLVAQHILGIVSGDLAPGEKLRSGPEIARRFHVHPNTVRAAYRALASRGWLEWRQGSGFYVRRRPAFPDRQEKSLDQTLELDWFVAEFVEAARQKGYSLDQLQLRIQRWASLEPPDHILAIEADEELRAILISELKQGMRGIDIRVEGSGLDLASGPALRGAYGVTLLSNAEKVRSRLPMEIPLLNLSPRSVSRSIAGQARPPEDIPITVISRWPDFLKWARTTLTGVGLDPAALDLRDARRKGWDRGLNSRSFIITDSLIASALPDGAKPHIFQIISEESIAELRQLWGPATQSPNSKVPGE